MNIVSYLFAALSTTLNIILYVISFGRFLWLEGRVLHGIFRNWGRHFTYQPVEFAKPTSEQEIIALIKNSQQLRVYGSGHSFNSGVVSDQTLMSLNDYTGVIWIDREKKQISVKGGMRIRDINKHLLQEGWAFGALPSHDAQSIAGIISTDVHGTGRDWGFVSQSVVRIKIINGRGEVIECDPTDDLFRAAIGGIGAIGIIVEVVLQAVGRFNIAQKTFTADLTLVEENLGQLLENNEHFSLYIFPFTRTCQINTWNRSNREQSFLGPLREFASITVDSLAAVWIANLLAHTGLLPRFSTLIHKLKPGTNLILESNKAFNRTIYPAHWELEFTVPFEDTFDVVRQFLELYEEMYPLGLPYTAVELRFTPGGHERTLIGAGYERQSTWVDIVTVDSAGWQTYFDAAEGLMKEIMARPHLGKYCRNVDRPYLERVHAARFDKFQQLIKQHDPQGKFANAFTKQLFGDLV